MINDYTMLDGLEMPEANLRDLVLWAYVLGKGVRDFAEAELRRARLEKILDGGSQERDRLSQQLASFNANLNTLKQLRRTDKARLGAKAQRLLNREALSIEKLLTSKVYEDVLVFLGYDEPTAWFWSDSVHVGSIRWVHSLFPSLPPLDSFRRRVVREPQKIADSTI